MIVLPTDPHYVCAALVLRSACLIAFSLSDAAFSAASVGEIARPRVSFCGMWLRLSQELEELIPSQVSFSDYFEQQPSLYPIMPWERDRALVFNRVPCELCGNATRKTPMNLFASARLKNCCSIAPLPRKPCLVPG
jgi:hypothetical protein